jgi:hypothetical protein
MSITCDHFGNACSIAEVTGSANSIISTMKICFDVIKGNNIINDPSYDVSKGADTFVSGECAVFPICTPTF